MSLVVGLFGLALLIWMIPVARSGRLLVLAMLTLAVGTVFGPNFFAIDGMIQFSLDRVLFFAIVGLAAVGFRNRLTKVPVPNRIDWLVIAIVGWFGFSAATGGGDPPGTPPMARWLFYIAMPAGMYFIARLVKTKAEDIRILQIGLVSMGVYLACTAVFEAKGLHGLVFPRFIVDSETWEFYGRGRGPLLNPSGNGILISIALAAAMVGLIQGKRDRKLLYGVIIACLFAGIYATLTRSAWLGGAATLGMIAFLYVPRSIRVSAIGGMCLIALVATTSMKDELFRLKRDQNLSAADSEKSIKLRPLLAIVAWEMFKDQPLVGHGYGHYFAKHKPYHEVRGYELPLAQARPYAQHNVLLAIIVDTGLIGFMLFVSWFLSVAAVAWRLSRDGASRPERRAIGLVLLGTITAYLCNGMFQDTMIIPMVHMYLFLFSGVAVNVMQQGLEILPSQRRRRRLRTATVVASPA